MKRPAFDRYHTAFGALLDCGASDAPAKQCIDGWLSGVGDLVPTGDREYAVSLLDYYLKTSLRADPAKAKALCESED